MSTTNKASAWYEEWFDREEYYMVYRKRDEADARKLLALIERVTEVDQGAKVLDMACGRGRHAILLARRGFHVTGIDLSRSAIETARKMALVESISIEFKTGDMRESPCTACFGLVVNLFTSFGYFDEDEENARAVRAMAESLVVGGWLVQDFMNGEYWSKNFVPYDERSEDGMVLKQRRWVERDRLNKEITIIKDDGSEQKFNESVRLFGLNDFEQMHAGAGLKVEHVFGDSDGRAYDDESQRLIIFSKRLEQQ